MTMSLKYLEEKKETKEGKKSLELEFAYDANPVDVTGAGNPTPALRNPLTEQRTDSTNKDDVHNVKAGEPACLTQTRIWKGMQDITARVNPEHSEIGQSIMKEYRKLTSNRDTHIWKLLPLDYGNGSIQLLNTSLLIWMTNFMKE